MNVKALRKPIEDKGRNGIALTVLDTFKTIPDLQGYKDKRLLISPAMAEDLLRLNYIGQRTLRQDQVKTLHRAMASKTDYAPNNLIALSYDPDNPDNLAMVALLNGQHTLTAISLSGVSQPLVISLFPCRTKAEIEWHYSLFDQGRARNQLDVSRAVGLADTIRQHKLPKQAMNALAGASTLLRAHLKDARSVAKDKLRNARISRDWMKETAAIYKLMETEDRRKNSKAPLIGEYGKVFRKRLVSPSFFAVLLVAMRSHPGETITIVTDLLKQADEVDRGDKVFDELLYDVVNFLSEANLGTGTDRRIATRNFIKLFVAIRDREDGEEVDVEDIIIDSTPSVKESDALWDILTEDRLSRSIVNV